MTQRHRLQPACITRILTVLSLLLMISSAVPVGANPPIPTDRALGVLPVGITSPTARSQAPRAANSQNTSQASSMLVVRRASQPHTIGLGTFHSCAIKSDQTVFCWGRTTYGLQIPPAGTFTELTGGRTHMCGLKTDSTIVCWGWNGFGQSTPPAGTFIQVSAGDYHTCALKSDSSVICWGQNTSGEAAPPLGSFIEVGGGFTHSCGLKPDGTVVCWGDNINGQATPPAVSFKTLSVGSNHNCGIKLDDTVVCWGSNGSGQTAAPTGSFSQVLTGYQHSCGVRLDGTITCWGDNSYGQDRVLGGTFKELRAGYFHQCGIRNDDTIECWGGKMFSDPTVEKFTQISAGAQYNCGIKLDATLHCWGTPLLFSGHTPTTPPVGRFKAISASETYACAIKTDNTLRCWGDNDFGQVTPPAGTFSQVSVAYLHACGLKSDATIVCWGITAQGATPPTGLIDRFSQISTGRNHSCGLKLDATIVCWGRNTDGQATPPIGSFSQVSIGNRHSCAIKTDSTLVCWGYNPYANPPTGTFTQIEAGPNHTCALKTDQLAICWGSNGYGETQRPTTPFVAVSAGYQHNCALEADGTPICCGDYNYGQAPQPLIIPPTLPTAHLNQPFSQTIRMRETLYIPTQPVYSLKSGSLPPGFTLSSAGLLSGTPIQTGTFSFTLRAVDSYGFTASRTYVLQVPSPELDMSAAMSAPTAQPGDSLLATFVLSVTEQATSVVFTNPLPANLTGPSNLTPGATYDPATRQIRWTGTVTPGTPKIISYAATVGPLPPGSLIVNRARLTGIGQTVERVATVAISNPLFNQTLMLIYATADNDLSDEVLDLVNRAEQQAGNPNAAVLLLLDGPQPADSYLYRLQPDWDGSCPNYLNPSCDGHYLLNTNMWQWNDDTGTPYSLAEFVKGASRLYPNARQRSLALVGHGGGWSPNVLAGQPQNYKGQGQGGLLWDQSQGSSLSTQELGEALRWSSVATGKRLDLLFLDACLMGMSEVAYEVTDSVNYLLTSENWKWARFPYDQHLAAITATSTPQSLGLAWLQNEASSLRAESSNLPDPEFPYPFTYALLDLTANKLDTVVRAQDTLVQSFDLATDRAPLLAAFNASERFDSDQNGTLNSADDYIDLGSFAAQVQQRFAPTSQVYQAAASLAQAVAATRISETHENGMPWPYPDQTWEWQQLSGLSGFLPLANDTWKRRYYTATQLRLAKDSLWDEFLNQWWANVAPPADPACPPDCTLVPPLPLLPLNDDLFILGSELTTMTPNGLNRTPRVGEPIVLGLPIHREGGKQRVDVSVRFYLGNPATGGTLLGTSSPVALSPTSAATPIVTFSWIPTAIGTNTIFALVDPLNTVAESNETNNLTNRTLQVLAPRPDTITPRVDSLVINGGAAQTLLPQVTLTVRASDNVGGSGMEAVQFVEWIQHPLTGQWLQGPRSAWLPYTTTPQNYSWTLSGGSGVRMIQAWAIDRAGNISLDPYRATINFVPATIHINRGEIHVYRYPLRLGETLNVRVVPLPSATPQNDPDLYIWTPDPNAPRYVSNLNNAPDSLTISAAVAGVYQVEVYGYTAADYQLEVTITPAGTLRSTPHPLDPNKPLPTRPFSVLTEQPLGGQPTATLSQMIYLALLRR